MSAYTDLIAADSPIAYWPLSDAAGATTVADLGPNNLTGTVRSGVTFGVASMLSGSNGTAMGIVAGGSGAGFDVPTSAPFSLPGDYTIEFWVKTAVTAVQVVLKMGNSSYFGIQGKPSAGGSLSNTTVADGATHHVAFVAASGQLTTYVDGVADGPSVGQLGPFGDGFQPHVGYYFDYNPGLGLTGTLQHVAIYDKALTPQKLASRAAFKASSVAPFLSGKNLSDVAMLSGTSATVTAPLPTGGSGTYSYAWHLGNDPGFTPSGSTLVAGQTGRTATFAGLPVGTRRWAVCVASDGTTSSTSYHRLVKASGLAPLRIGVIGDSTEVINDSSATMAIQLRTVGGDRAVTVINKAVSGSTPLQWAAGTANTNAAQLGFYPNGSSSPPLDYLLVGLGMNAYQTGQTADQFRDQMVAAIAANATRGEKVLLNYPVWREPGIFFESPGLTFDEAGNSLPIQYQAVLDSLVDDETIFAGDRTSYDLFASHPTLYLNRSDSLPGGIHPNALGAEIMGMAKAAALLRAEAGDGGGGTTPGTSTDPGVANVRSGVAYQINGASLTGTYALNTANYSDPGVANVRAGTTYKYAGANLVGTLATGGGGTGPGFDYDEFFTRFRGEFGPLGDAVAALTGTVVVDPSASTTTHFDRDGVARFRYDSPARTSVTVLAGGGL